MAKVFIFISLALACFHAHGATRSDCIGDEGGATVTPGSSLQTAIDTAPLIANARTIVLCQAARFEISNHISLPSYTKIFTRGLPTQDALKATLFYKVGSGLVNGAVIASYASNQVELRNIIVDGMRTNINIEPSLDEARRNRTLIAIGGTGSVIDRVRVVNSIGLEAISAADDPNCDGLQITNSFIGYSGFFAKLNNIGQWADGIGVYCKNATIANNEIRDVTDGGITIYGGTNTSINNNWIANSGRSGISGIVVAAAFSNKWPVSFLGSTINNNLIQTAASTQLQVGISAGSRMWCYQNAECNYISGISILNNSGNGRFGYGLVVAGMNNVTLTGNNIVMTRWDNPNWVGSFAKCGWSNNQTNWYVVESGTTGNNLQSGYNLRSDVTGCIGLTN